jgi:predicted regulator of Ras-like GTPase activity (Roadblock/LC7/MglB family)
MAELSPVRSALDEIKNQDHVLDASLISRGGMYIMGGPVKGIHRETYAAMSAIMIGAAETASTDLKDQLVKVRIDLTEQILLLVAVGPKYLVALLVDFNADIDSISKNAKTIMSRIDMEL